MRITSQPQLSWQSWKHCARHLNHSMCLAELTVPCSILAKQSLQHLHPYCGRSKLINKEASDFRESTLM